MNFGFFTDQDATRFSGLRLRRLKEALKDPKLLEPLARTLGATDAGMKAIERRIDELRATKSSKWSGVPAPEILAASIFESRQLADGAVERLFNHARREEDLAAPVLTWVKGAGLTSAQHLTFGAAHIDVVGYRKGFLSGARVVAIATKNDAAQIEQAIEMLKTISPLTNATYVACTPAAVAEYLATYAALPSVNHWDADALRLRLNWAGAGLLAVEGDAISQAILAPARSLSPEKLREIEAIVTAMTER